MIQTHGNKLANVLTFYDASTFAASHGQKALFIILNVYSIGIANRKNCKGDVLHNNLLQLAVSKT
jgi:hypothetical protein